MDEIDCIVCLIQTYPTADFIKLTNLLLAFIKVIDLRVTEPKYQYVSGNCRTSRGRVQAEAVVYGDAPYPFQSSAFSIRLR
jgi:hypothetical protein